MQVRGWYKGQHKGAESVLGCLSSHVGLSVLGMTTRKDTNAATKRRILATLVAAHGNRCMVTGCGRENLIIGGPTTDGMTFNLGHVVSEANGGHFRTDNLLPICRRCNKDMGQNDWPVSMMVAAPRDLPLVPDTGTRETNMLPGPLSSYWTEV